MDGISFAQRLRYGCEQVRVLVVAVDVGTVFLYRVLYLQHGRVFSRLGVQYAYTVRLFHGEIDVLEDTFALASRAESIDRHCHAGAQGYKKQYDVQCHFNTHKKDRAARTSGGPARVQHSIGPHVARGGFLSTVIVSSSRHRRTRRAALSWYAALSAV
ncbi:hypothetical protein IMSAGC004_01688 [Bacteroidaceae bacterium]|nr:hypothetical protein IMSAGC004_01688 [Bacteroidaceae bacterium]